MEFLDCNHDGGGGLSRNLGPGGCGREMSYRVCRIIDDQESTRAVSERKSASLLPWSPALEDRGRYIPPERNLSGQVI